jgi:hypothetical protein
LLSVDPLPNVVGVLAEVPPPDEVPLPDDPLDEADVVVTAFPLRTLVGGAPPPPPPPQAVKTNIPTAAAKGAAIMFFRMKSPLPTKRGLSRTTIQIPGRTNASWLVLVPPKFASTTEIRFVCGNHTERFANSVGQTETVVLFV